MMGTLYLLISEAAPEVAESSFTGGDSGDGLGTEFDVVLAVSAVVLVFMLSMGAVVVVGPSVLIGA